MDTKTSNNRPLIHRGFAHTRTLQTGPFSDTKREKALSDKWEEDNPPPGQFGVQPVLNALVPDCTQRDAMVAATVVQWLGSQVGFSFLNEALASVGYEIVQRQKSVN